MTDDTGARRAVVALMLLGIALDAAVAPASGAALPTVRASLQLSDAAATWSIVLLVTLSLSKRSRELARGRNHAHVHEIGYASTSSA